MKKITVKSKPSTSSKGSGASAIFTALQQQPMATKGKKSKKVPTQIPYKG